MRLADPNISCLGTPYRLPKFNEPQAGVIYGLKHFFGCVAAAVDDHNHFQRIDCLAKRTSHGSHNQFWAFSCWDDDAYQRVFHLLICSEQL
jgi:hypothetical protein